MKRYSIEWSGTISRDIGWDEIEAASPEEAREKYLAEHGQYRRIRGVMEVVSPDDPSVTKAWDAFVAEEARLSQKHSG